ncbi:MAG TPA: NAD(P)/FAD-dependent oxidoreductase, partial [Candidatus Thermoplasmatota archaeon]
GRLHQKVETGQHVVSADPAAGEVVTEDGEVRTADLVVGADGMQSQVREAVIPGFRPRAMGITAARGLVADDGEMALGFARLAFGRGRGAGRATCGSGVIYWYISWRDGLEDSVSGAARHFSKDVVDLVARTSPEHVRLDPLFETPPAPAWQRGRIALLGDSIHAMAPHAGQGACQALEDAVALGEAVGGRGALGKALESYEAERRPPSERAVRVSRRNARVILMRNPLACFARDFALRLVPKSVMVRGFGGIQARVS